VNKETLFAAPYPIGNRLEPHSRFMQSKAKTGKFYALMMLREILKK